MEFFNRRTLIAIVMAVGLSAGVRSAEASSHREAPQITEMPKVDGTDFYMFRSYEPGRADYVTLLANDNPLQDAYGGPNYFTLDPQANYDIHIDNDGDAAPNITFRIRALNVLRGLSLDIGGSPVAVALAAIGPFSAVDNGLLNVVEFYTIQVIRDGDELNSKFVTNPADGSLFFPKPADYIGTKSIPDYPTYAGLHVRNNVLFPGCSAPGGRVFVGQRKEGFVVNLGETFDLVNYNAPAPAVDSEANTIDDKNVTTIALEVPIACLTGADSIIGGWTTASLPRTRSLIPGEGIATTSGPIPVSYYQPTLEGGDFIQVSRLGMPLVNEVVIGLGVKDEFNGSRPRDDAKFAVYVTNPTFPKILEILFGPGSAANISAVRAPNIFPRRDLVQVFLTGIPGLNQTTTLAKFPSEMQRLNTAIGATPMEDQHNLGVIGGDLAGFPNGRRPGDDVVDIELRVLMGALFQGTPDEPNAPAGGIPFSDGAVVSAADFFGFFPYLKTPIPGSPN